MDLLTDWLGHVWSLMQSVGWWIMVGLVFSALLEALTPRKVWEMKGTPAAAALLGGLLPICNFGVVPIGLGILRASRSMASAMTFITAAGLLNPAALLFAWGYMGPLLTAVYFCAALGTSALAGMLSYKYMAPPEGAQADIPHGGLDALRRSLLTEGPAIAMWVCIGILAQAALMALFPPSVYSGVMTYPAGASALDTALMALFRHVCIPDDLAFTASLVASGLAPGGALVYLLMGVATNLPSLFGLAAMRENRAIPLYLASSVLGCIAAYCLTQLLVAPNFVPHFNLEGADLFALWANRLNIGIWPPMRVPCAVMLAAMGLWGLWIRLREDK